MSESRKGLIPWNKGKKSSDEQKIAKKPKKNNLNDDNSISLNVKTTINLFTELEYDLKKIRNGQRVKPIYY